MLRDEMIAFEQLSGENAEITSISRIGGFLDGYQKAMEKQQWIPCSERMPECDYTDVLICVHDKRKGCEKDYYIISAYTSGRHWEPTLAVDMTDFDVVAWMPLPEPYKEEK